MHSRLLFLLIFLAVAEASSCLSFLLPKSALLPQIKQAECQYKPVISRHDICRLAMANSTAVERRMISFPKPRITIGPRRNTPFIPWKLKSYESNGDYRSEQHLEDYIGGRLYETQKDLPLLPIPTLQETANRFLPTALPLCENEEERQTLREACARFEDEAKTLQDRLLQRRDEYKNSSWLQQWWNIIGYLQVRDPVCINVSYFLSISDDSTLADTVAAYNEEDNGMSNGQGLCRAAAALHAAALERKRVCSGSMKCDSHRNYQLCSVGYKYLFHSCRIPKKGQDTFRIYDPSQHQHCIVACKGYFFAVDFVDEQSNPLPLDVLLRQLRQCVDEAQHQEEIGIPKLGWLTGCDRDSWADSREELLRRGGVEMEKALSLLESGALVICLDDERPQSRTESSKVFWYGNDRCGCNRWYDKSLQVVVTVDGKLSLVCEHSMFDAMTPMGIITQILKKSYRKIRRSEMGQPLPTLKGSGVTNIFQNCWADHNVRNIAKDLAVQAESRYKKLKNSVELEHFLFRGYGKDFIKHAHISPDAYLQQAMQLASYRLFGTQVGTYEATQVRRFLHGRTETTRAVSLESEAFVKTMGESKRKDDTMESKSEKLSLLHKAAEAHRRYTMDASNGLGVDRHFLGLSLLAENDIGANTPSLFSHPAFVRSKTWRLSTSSLPYCPGFGPVVPNGIGIGYGIKNDSCTFIVTSRHENDYSKRFCDLLEEALEEMGKLVEAEETKDSWS